MTPDDEICYCYHVSLRKLLNFARREKLKHASQLSDCLGAGTGCGWCIPTLCRIADAVETGEEFWHGLSREAYAAQRDSYNREKKPRHRFYPISPVGISAAAPDETSAASGAQEQTPGAKLRFAILEHETREGVHWDLLLTQPGQEKLATWRLDHDPFLLVGEVPATRLPDHRPVYLVYEGPISGDRGVVRRVDEGDLQIVSFRPDEVVAVLHGQRLRGGVELRESGARWTLLIRK
jgi:bacterioferritin-associated ferredoxin